MTAYLEYTAEDGEMRRCRCAPITSIGRDLRCEIRLVDPLVSRHHAMVRRVSGGGWYAMDLGSSNGTYLNGARLTIPTALDNNDVLKVGDTALHFLWESLADSSFGIASGPGGGPLPETMTMGPAVTPVTILVADLRGYTRLSESLSIPRLSKLMNRWFEDVGQAVRRTEGIVDKFIGDAVMARWEGLGSSRAAVIQSLRGALAILAVTDALGREQDSLPVPLQIGVGINTGVAATGLGADGSPLGDDVNVAFRLERATRQFDCDLVLSASSCRHLPGQGDVPMEELSLRGRATPVGARLFTFAAVRTLLAELDASTD